jgi:hypothetical protein
LQSWICRFIETAKTNTFKPISKTKFRGILRKKIHFYQAILKAQIYQNEGYKFVVDIDLEKRGHKFVRYADDCNIYVKTFRAGERVMKSVKEFIEKKLKLKVNEKKSKVDVPSKRKFLGFSFLSLSELVNKRRVAPESIKRFKDKIRDITRLTRRVKFIKIIAELTVYLRGRKGYYNLTEVRSDLRELDRWIRHRLRNYIWQQLPVEKGRGG